MLLVRSKSKMLEVRGEFFLSELFCGINGFVRFTPDNFFLKPHQNLEAWKKSFSFVINVYRATEEFPADERFGLISQMRRCSVSIPSNIAEGAGRKSKKEFIQFLSISLGSSSELDTQLLLSKELGFMAEDKCTLLISELDLIGKLIYGLMKSLGYKSEQGVACERF